MAQQDELGLLFRAPTKGKNVERLWEFCWMLRHKTKKFNQYCFGSFNDKAFDYDDGLLLDYRKIHRLSLSEDQLKRIFSNKDLLSAKPMELIQHLQALGLISS